MAEQLPYAEGGKSRIWNAGIIFVIKGIVIVKTEGLIYNIRNRRSRVAG